MKKLIILWGLVLGFSSLGAEFYFLPKKMMNGFLHGIKVEQVSSYGGHDWRFKSSGVVWQKNYVELRGRIERERNIPGWPNGKASYSIRFSNSNVIQHIRYSADGGRTTDINATLKGVLGRCYGRSHCFDKNLEAMHSRIQRANVGRDWKQVLQKILTHVAFYGRHEFTNTTKAHLSTAMGILFTGKGNITRYFWGQRAGVHGVAVNLKKKVLGNERTFEGYLHTAQPSGKPVYFLVRYRGNQLQPIYVAYKHGSTSPLYQRLGAAADQHVSDYYGKEMTGRLYNFLLERLGKQPDAPNQWQSSERLIVALALGFRWKR